MGVLVNSFRFVSTATSGPSWVTEWSDDFTATEDPIVGWTKAVGTVKAYTTGGKVYAGSDGGWCLTNDIEFSSDDMAVQVVSSSNDVSVFLRTANPAPYANSERVVRLVNGELYVRGSYVGNGHPDATNKIFRVEVIGDAIEVFLDGSPIYDNASSWASTTGNRYGGIGVSETVATDDALGQAWT